MIDTATPAPEASGSDDPGPSKSRRKADAHALQALGAQLVALNRHQLAQIDMPEPLLDAVHAAQRIHAREGRRRQLQYIGRLMRNVDAAPIRAKIASWKSVSAEETARLHALERWRDRLVDDPAAVQALADAHPETDLQQVRTLIRNTRREREQGKPPKSYRALFHLLRDIIPA